jgi:hypothetical protein
MQGYTTTNKNLPNILKFKILLTFTSPANNFPILINEYINLFITCIGISDSLPHMNVTITRYINKLLVKYKTNSCIECQMIHETTLRNFLRNRKLVPKLVILQPLDLMNINLKGVTDIRVFWLSSIYEFNLCRKGQI